MIAFGQVASVAVESLQTQKGFEHASRSRNINGEVDVDVLALLAGGIWVLFVKLRFYAICHDLLCEGLGRKTAIYSLVVLLKLKLGKQSVQGRRADVLLCEPKQTSHRCADFNWRPVMPKHFRHYEEGHSPHQPSYIPEVGTASRCTSLTNVCPSPRKNTSRSSKIVRSTSMALSSTDSARYKFEGFNFWHSE